MTRPLVIGHRGAPGYRPEHTRSSYELAIAMGADAVEPDVVVSKDGVLVVRHDTEIGSTTDVSQHPEFLSRRTQRVIDGEAITGWFADDFTWDELSTLRCRERLPAIRPGSAAFDGTEPLLRLVDLVDLVLSRSRERGSAIGLVVEIKHATALAQRGWQLDALVDAELRAHAGAVPFVIESFEPTVLERLRARGLPAQYIYLLAASGSPPDLVAAKGAAPAKTYAETAMPTGLEELVGRFHGISVDKSMILAADDRGRATGPSRVVADAHDRGLSVFTWTCRPENRFLLPGFRAGGEAEFGRYREEWAVIRDAAVDGVFVDHADLGVEFFR